MLIKKKEMTEFVPKARWAQVRPGRPCSLRGRSSWRQSRWSAWRATIKAGPGLGLAVGLQQAVGELSRTRGGKDFLLEYLNFFHNFFAILFHWALA